MPFQSEKQRRYLWANEPEIARDWTDRYGAAGGGIMRIPLGTGGFPDFFQMTPENIAQAKSMPWREAFSQDFNLKNPNYRGFSTAYQGADKTGFGKYASGGLKSLVGAYTPGSNVGGATPLTRKLALGAKNVLPRLLSKAALPLELLRATPANADEVNMTEEDWINLRNENAPRDYTAGEHYDMTPDNKIRAMRQDLKSVPNHIRRQTSFPTSTAQQFANLRQPHKGFAQSGADLDKWGNRRMALENPAKDPYKAPSGLASLMKDFKTKTGEGWDFATQLPGMAMSALSGIPGLGFLLSSIKPDPRDKYLGDPYSMQNYRGRNYGYGNTLRHGNLKGQDQFGINTRSLFGDYQGHYGKFMNNYLAGNIKKNKFNKAKYDFAQEVTGTNPKTSPNITGTPLITSTSIHQGPDTPQGGNYGAAVGTPGAWSPGARDGGRMARGGLASLWPR